MSKIFRHPLTIIVIVVVAWFVYKAYYDNKVGGVGTVYKPTVAPIVPTSSSMSQDSREFS